MGFMSPTQKVKQTDLPAFNRIGESEYKLNIAASVSFPNPSVQINQLFA